MLLAQLPLERLANLPGVVVRVDPAAGRAIDQEQLDAIDCRGRAVLIHTGWDRHWGTDAYFAGNLAALPTSGFRFSAVPPRIAGMGTFPVRAHAIIS